MSPTFLWITERVLVAARGTVVSLAQVLTVVIATAAKAKPPVGSRRRLLSGPYLTLAMLSCKGRAGALGPPGVAPSNLTSSTGSCNKCKLEVP